MMAFLLLNIVDTLIQKSFFSEDQNKFNLQDSMT